MIQDFSFVLYTLFVFNLLFLLRVGFSFVTKELTLGVNTRRKVKMRKQHFVVSCLGLTTLIALVISAIQIG